MSFFDFFKNKKAVEEKRCEGSKLEQLQKMCNNLMADMHVDRSVCSPYLDRAFTDCKENGEDVPDGNIRRNAYLLIFNSIVLHLCENDYRLDGYILNAQGNYLEDRLKLIADRLVKEGLETEEVKEEILKNSIQRIWESRTQRNLEDKEKKVSMSVVRNEFFWDKVKVVYHNVYSAMNLKFLSMLSEGEFISLDPQSGMINLNINDEEQVQRFNIYEVEIERYCSYVFKKWFLKKFTDLSSEERKEVEDIINSVLAEVMKTDDNQDYINDVLINSCNRWNDFEDIDIERKRYGYHNGKGNVVKINPNLDEESGKIMVIYDAIAWMFTDIIYVTHMTSKSFCYEDIVKYIEENPLEDVRKSMRLVRIYGQLSDISMEILQTVNWMATREFLEE